jgi:ferric-dicitrate binding protein FerR (iron transport regulator)
VRLDLGTLYGVVARQRFGDKLQFITPQAQATVLGTDLKLLTLRGRTELEVYSGKVYLAGTAGADGVQVNAGYAGLVTDSQQISQGRIPSGSGSVQSDAGWIFRERTSPT